MSRCYNDVGPDADRAGSVRPYSGCEESEVELAQRPLYQSDILPSRGELMHSASVGQSVFTDPMDGGLH